MFLPGDFFLGILFLGVVRCFGYLNPNTDPSATFLQTFWMQPWWPILVAAVTTCVVVVMRKFIDAPNYAPRAANSPTKWYHDVGCYGVYAWILASIGIPAVFLTSWSGNEIFVIIGLAGWLGGGVLDTLQGGVFKNASEVRHPSDWRWSNVGPFGSIITAFGVLLFAAILILMRGA